MMHRIISLLLLASSSLVVVAVPPNDRCIDSVTLEPFVKVDGDNTEANFDYNNQGVCGSRSDRRAVWYEINGAGKEVTVNVCTNNEQLTDFGVFRACNTQNCLGAPPQQFVVANCDDEESNEYVFFGNEGESYYIHVRSDVVFEGVGTKHTIWYTEPTDPPTVAPEEPESTESGEAAAESASPRVYDGFAVISGLVSALAFGFSL
mmetsp:Transcript_9559/g.23816  ORF Transcript_9559/g.23816 Transcript_9559/m.23816 type:complete len:205 (+) Transcript_9559:120-734(+)|eukprot:CAMPEP_0116084564 /NCGR_PEP_ID=MMETSP0327-20121206/3865_2 /TAXON_ID=44447 /ORGANISM="Pseudo-nitzschia delicatissima, Strain B596" /LENGTH=204 /DNA_ID=CAMNT_0003575509 /DNA_START=60 /DNA_END=674 /DNA_ORIENTATION=-